MFKNAALAVLEIQSLCSKYGYELKDAHPKNILFRGNEAVYVDIGSFRKMQYESWCAINEFVSSLYIPLSLWANGEFYITRKLLESNLYKIRTIPHQDTLDSGLLKSLKFSPFNYVSEFRGEKGGVSATYSSSKALNSRVLNKIASTVKGRRYHVSEYKAEVKCIESLKADILRMTFPEVDTQWKDYYTNIFSDGVDTLPVTPRLARIIELATEISKNETINSSLDLSGNSGLLSFKLSDQASIERITTADYDETVLEQAFQIQQQKGTTLNLVLQNFMLDYNSENTTKRLKSDMVFALAVTHHLLLTAGFLLTSIFERINSYSNKYVFIEFMPLGLWSQYHSDEFPKVPEWYTRDNFRKEFEKYFDLVTEEVLEENRILFIGTVKK